MKSTLWRRASELAILLVLTSGIPMLAETTLGLTVPVTGSNSFSGTATINRFVNQGGQIVAIGSVANSSRTAFAGVAWQVTLSPNTASPNTGSSAGYSGQAPAAHLTQIAWSPTRQSDARIVPVQNQGTSCGVLNLSLASPTTVNLAGASVTLNAIGLSVSGQSGTPVGGIVCSLSTLVTSVGGIVGSVANVVNLLNTLLGSLTGALGGLTGGLGGAGGA
ncbi:MAG TPA: hypothetical protein VM912_03050 [Terriglobales bacterium]|nr:hypothetical protein [Terriglobales bacterium]